MRLLVAGLVCLVIGVALTEYLRRNPPKVEASAPAGAEDGGVKRPKLPRAVEALLETAPFQAPAGVEAAPFAAMLAAPAEPRQGVQALTGGLFPARELRGGFSAALFVMDVGAQSAVVRAAAGEAAKVVLPRPGRVTALSADGSTVFLAEDGAVISTSSRGDEALVVRARFVNATVTSLSSAGDTVLATLMPKDGDPLSTERVGAVVSLASDGAVTLVASEQVRPRDAFTDGKEAFWVAGFPPGLWRGALDGAFSSQLVERAEGPLVLDGDGVLFRAVQGSGVELRRVGKAGGNQQTLATADVAYLVASSGLVRFATAGQAPKLFEVTTGAEPTELFALPGAPRGLALAGTSLFVLTAGDDGKTTLLAK